MEIGLDDPGSWPAGASLDLVAEAVFSGPAGNARLRPLLDRFAAEVGTLREVDEDFAQLQVLRGDWALCEAAVAEGGDTWCWRVARGDPELCVGEDREPLREEGRVAASTIVGLFELWPGRECWLRDRLAGVCVRLLDPPAPLPPAGAAPAALWEARLLLDARRDGAVLCRPPLPYPLELVEWLEGHQARRFAVPPWPSLQQLRRARLHWSRGKRREPFTRWLDARGG